MFQQQQAQQQQQQNAVQGRGSLSDFRGRIQEAFFVGKWIRKTGFSKQNSVFRPHFRSEHASCVRPLVLSETMVVEARKVKDHSRCSSRQRGVRGELAVVRFGRGRRRRRRRRRRRARTVPRGSRLDYVSCLSAILSGQDCSRRFAVCLEFSLPL